MMRFSVSYTKAMNERYGLVGALFQGAFGAKHVPADEYLVHLSRYIHLNPVLLGLVKRQEEWEYSGYREYIGIRRGTPPEPEIVPGQFTSPQAYREFVEGVAERDREMLAHLLFD